MKQIDAATVKDLLGLDTGGLPVVSFYLDVDGGRYPRRQDLWVEGKALLRRASDEWLADHRLSRQDRESLKEDLIHLGRFLEFEFEREGVSGLAIFSCSGRNFWQVYELPVVVPSRVVIGREPYSRPLVAVLDQYRRYAVVTVDRRKARIFSVFLSQVEEYHGIYENNVPDQVREGEWAGLRQKKIAHHIDDHVRRHLKSVASTTMSFFKSRGFDWLILAGPREMTNRLEETLHPYLRDRVVAKFSASPDDPLSSILEESLRVERRVQQRDEKRLVTRVVEESGPGGQGVLGVESTLEAVTLGQVHELLFSDSPIKGFVCRKDHFVSAHMDVCPICDRPNEPVDDIVEEAVELAVNTNCHVRQISHVPEFTETHRMGALLRFAV